MNLCLYYVLALLIFLLPPSLAQASGIPAYTAIDLGSTESRSTDSTGQGLVVDAPGTTAYRFDWTNSTGSDALAQSITPIPSNPNTPYAHGNPLYAFSYIVSAMTDGNGFAAGNNITGVSGHFERANAFIAYQKPDGSWGTAEPLWSGYDNIVYPTNQNVVTGINKLGQVLGVSYSSSNYDSGDPVLFDSRTGMTTYLNTLLKDARTSFYNTSGLDEEGRILVLGLVHDPERPYDPQMHVFLLTPAGVDSSPIPVPEPTVLATLGMVAVATVARKTLVALRRSRS